MMRSPFPSLIGLCLGISMSLVLTNDWPIPPSTCTPSNLSPQAKDSSPELYSTNSAEKHFSFDYGNEDDFSPRRVKLSHKPMPSKPRKSKLLRPRYVSTELGIREKLFVGVLSSDKDLNSFAVGFNHTVAPHVSKLGFFSDSRGSSPNPSGMSVVRFSDDKPYLHPFNMLKYAIDHYISTYSYFLFVSDHTYVHARMIMKMLNNISVSESIYMGHILSALDTHPCDVHAGILLSHNILSRVSDSLEWCMKNAVSGEITLDVERCIHHATDMHCSDQLQEHVFQHFHDNDLNVMTQYNELSLNPNFQNYLTVHKMNSQQDFYFTHKLLCEFELQHTKLDLQNVESDIILHAPLLPDRNTSFTWPIGLQNRVRPMSRFDVNRWDHFDDTVMYLTNDFSNINTLNGVDKLDVEDIVQVSQEKISALYPGRIENIQLLNGYRRFDPLRGMEYTLDLSIRDTLSGKDKVCRIELVRPLGKVEMVPMPYVTESTRVNIVLPVSMETKDEVVSFLDMYAHTCLDAGDNANLFVVFLYEHGDPHGDTDPFSVIKSMIAYYESKYLNGARMSWTSLKGVSTPVSSITLADAVSERHIPSTLLFFCTAAMQLSVELLNRVRMNTIQGWQVFFPVGFWQFKPSLVYKSKPYPTNIEISKEVGHFDSLITDHMSFYNSDYSLARKNMVSTGNHLSEIYDIFLKHSSLHVLRAVEPALRLRFHEHICGNEPDSAIFDLNREKYYRCLQSRADGLASRSQLAMLIFEHQQNINQQHLQAVQDQNNPHVPQMKDTDLLR